MPGSVPSLFIKSFRLSPPLKAFKSKEILPPASSSLVLNGLLEGSPFTKLHIGSVSVTWSVSRFGSSNLYSSNGSSTGTVKISHALSAYVTSTVKGLPLIPPTPSKSL